MNEHPELFQSLVGHAEKARRWLMDDALPIWSEKGVDRQRGGFVERLSLSGHPDETDRRARVAARQVYCFARGHRLGWDGPAVDIVRHGLDWLLGPARRSDGLIVHRAGLDGSVRDQGPDLYDQAFFLLALAEAHPLLPELHLDREAERVATHLAEAFAHSGEGFEDALPPRSPLRANPHMHLFEAAQAWIQVSPAETWKTLASDLHALMQRRFLAPESGALREFFEADWSPVGADRQMLEPGHHFEWAWLLMRWHAISGADTLETAARLFEIGELYGVDQGRGVAIDALREPDFAPVTREARLWPQTERLKAGLALSRVLEGKRRRAALSAAVSACEALDRYRAVPLPGLWRDRLREDDRFIDEPAPASSFYHLVCAYSELIGTTG